MSVLREDAVVELPSDDAVVARLDVILEELAAVVGDGTAVSDAVRIDRLARLEKLRAVTAAVQAAESVKFAQSQVGGQLAAEVHPDAIGRGIAEQIGLACRISLERGGTPAIDRAGLVVRPARHLPPTHQRGVE